MSDLLSFARGPALQFAGVVFVLGMTWRLVALALLPKAPTRAAPRPGSPGRTMGMLHGIASKWVPHKQFRKASMFHFVNGYVFHIGLAIVVFGFGPHIQFFSSLFGLSWPNLPSPVIYAAGAITLGSLMAALVRRWSNPVQRAISNLDDYFSWLVTALPVVTGLMAAGHLTPDYETILAVHILSVCALLIWFPFGKLMHAVLFLGSRGATGARLAPRGAKL